MITNYLQLIAQRYKGRLDKDADEFIINFAVDGARRMQSLISDLLDYSRAGRNKERQRVSLEDTAKRVRDSLNARIAETEL
jgi:light-regulated signal transduction histidine kinase (bacteriophytochrome)